VAAGNEKSKIMEEIKEFSVEIVLSNKDNRYTEDQIIDMIDKFCKENDLDMGGSIKEVE
jgi:hypothetical protein